MSPSPPWWGVDLCSLGQATLWRVQGNHPCHVQKVPFHSRPPQPFHLFSHKVLSALDAGCTIDVLLGDMLPTIAYSPHCGSLWEIATGCYKKAPL